MTVLCVALLLAMPALAQEPQTPAKKADEKAQVKPNEKPDAKTEKLDRVDISGNASDDEARRASTAAKMVIGREELMRYGDSSVSELMKRLPGVTTGGVAGRGGDIRMRGLAGGYTQILVNGERMPPGMSLETLPPEQVERIEVLRAPTAEFGARAIAGTVNIVLRQAPPKLVNELRLGLATENGNVRPSFNWSRNDKLDDKGTTTYNLTVNAQQSDFSNEGRGRSEIHDLRNGLDSVIETRSSNENKNRSLNISGRLQWKPSNRELLAISPFLSAGRGDGQGSYERTITPAPLPGDPLSRFDRSSNRFTNRFSGGGLNGQWNTGIGKEGKLESSAMLGRFSNVFGNSTQEFKGAQPVHSRQDNGDMRNGNWSLRSKFSQPLMDEHSFVAGVETEGRRMRQQRSCMEDGQSCDYLLDFGDQLDAGSRRVAVYAQDDWSVGKQWSFYAGLRWEAITTESTAKNYVVSNTSRVLTPLFHALYKFSNDPKKSRDQIRLSLTRSYRSPELNDVIARPYVNSLYPCPTGQRCQATNEFIYSDFAGNPQLQPELATGLDLAYEQYLSKGGVLSANLFVRRISNLVRRLTVLETGVEWSDAPRWVSRPRNIGTAISSGLELEAKFRLDQFVDGALPINVRSNLSLYKSSVDDIPGPHNRLAQQPRFTANLGGDYRLKSLPLSLGASLNYTPVNTLQSTREAATRSSKKQVLDGYASWNFDINTALRLSATNAAPQDFSNDTFTAAPEKTVATRNWGKTYTVWTLRLEMKL
ncbi:TonB-dependent receptor [Roseateles asaccharophilus]|uniref:Iron complex outermembrane receptor protein n=1 Tax=Roseateles asaccharophilus TaxID=582607 RepID=A0ABU2A221_9BURK|nr:TonB-dependent receptor [Roseateles asaccharophilus]MDR7331238.1 iron complex outermembrane receptor protein [Roseateles asaccharophilus]